MAKPQASPPQPPQPETKPAEPIINGVQTADVVWNVPYIFRLRKQLRGPFPGLWELAILDPSLSDNAKVVKIVDDANGLNYCIDNLQSELEDGGM